MEFWSPVTGVLGAALVILISYDLFRTVLTVSGGGPVAAQMAAVAWRLSLRVAAGRCHPPRWLAAVGPALAVLTLLVWLAGLWSGWTMIFSASPDAVVEAQSKAPASLVDRLYYVGYTLTTLGLGDFQPAPGGWRVATVLAAANGLFLFTMAITYIVPIVAATAAQRQLATIIDALGDDPADILARSWHDGGFDMLESHLVTLMPMIAAIREQHLAYPILHFFHSGEREAAMPVQLAVLDEALTLLAHGVEPAARPAPQTLGPLRAQLEGFLATLESAWIEPIRPAPSPPALGRCAEAGIPMRDAGAFAVALDAETERRACLHGLVRSDGWHWSHVGGADGAGT